MKTSDHRINEETHGQTGPGWARCRHCTLGLLAVSLLAAVGCAQSGGLEIAPGGEGDPTVAPGENAPGEGPSRICASSVPCGEGCCAAGEACVADRCVTASCTTSDECGADSRCTRGGACLPNNEGRVNASCRVPLDLPSLIPEIQCRWPGDTPPAVRPNSVQVSSSPMVMDFNLDGDPATVRPSIVFVSYEDSVGLSNGVLRVIDGETCELQGTLELSGLRGEVSPAIADLDPEKGDGPEIVVTDVAPINEVVSEPRVHAYKFRGSGFELMWSEIVTASGGVLGLAIHDIDNDGNPEVLTQRMIIDGRLGQQIHDMDNNAVEPPIVADLDFDGLPELTTGQGVFQWDPIEEVTALAGFWQERGEEAASFVAMADLGDYRTGLPRGEDSAELVMVGPQNLWVKSADGNSILIVNAGSEGIVGGPPVIADFDGDGRMEFASPGANQLTVFDLDCTRREHNEEGCSVAANPRGILWGQPSQGSRSGASVFDFDGNGSAEVVYADQCFLRIYDGASGNVLFSVARSGTTRWEYPVVVDADGDGHSELVVGSNDSDESLNCPSVDPLKPGTRFERTHGVTVWRDPQDRWVSSRPLWNQHMYNVTNVNDDGTVQSSRQITHWYREGAPNTYRQNVQGFGPSLELPDITVAANPAVDCSEQDQLGVTLSVCNRGTASVDSGMVTVNARAVGVQSSLGCSVANAGALPAGGCEQLRCAIDMPWGSDPVDIELVGDVTSQVSECLEGNNSAAVSEAFCAVPAAVR